MKDVACKSCGGSGEIVTDKPNGGTEVKTCGSCKGTGTRR